MTEEERLSEERVMDMIAEDNQPQENEDDGNR